MAQQRSNGSAADLSAARRRWYGERDAHLRQIHAYSFFMPARMKRSTTKLPAPLRYFQHLPASRLVRGLVLVAAPAYVALQISQGSEVGAAIGFSIALAAVLLAVSTFRMAVSNHGISFDIAGIRQVSSFGFLPLYAVREARIGKAPAEWPTAKLKGGWWPGRRRVSVLHLDETGSPRAFQVWVRNPEAFGVAVLGRELPD